MSKPVDVVDPVDRAVGRRIALRRRLLNMSQSDLGGRLGVSYQQIQKYEAGRNRVSASSIANISSILRVKAEYFFDFEASKLDEFNIDQQTFTLNSAFARISSRMLRLKIIELIELLAETAGRVETCDADDARGSEVASKS